MNTDLRSIGFSEVRDRLTGMRLHVYELLIAHGPCTGTELSKKTGVSVLSLRPRICDLRHMFHAVETGQRRDGEHEFRALSAAEAKQLHDAAKAESEFHPEPAENPNQLHLAV